VPIQDLPLPNTKHLASPLILTHHDIIPKLETPRYFSHKYFVHLHDGVWPLADTDGDNWRSSVQSTIANRRHLVLSANNYCSGKRCKPSIFGEQQGTYLSMCDKDRDVKTALRRRSNKLCSPQCRWNFAASEACVGVSRAHFPFIDLEPIDGWTTKVCRCCDSQEVELCIHAFNKRRRISGVN